MMRTAVCAALAAFFAVVGEAHEAGCGHGEHWDSLGLLQAHALVHRGEVSTRTAVRAVLPEGFAKQQADVERSRSNAAMVEENYEEKVLKLKETVALYRKAKEDVKHAQADAEQARSLLHSEADRLAGQEARSMRAAVAATAGEPINGTGPEEGVPAGGPAALDVRLARGAGGAAAEAREWSEKFLDGTRQAADDFARAAAALADAELPNLTSRFLDEAMTRLKASQQHALLVAVSAKQAMSGAVGETMTPVIGLLAQEVPRPSAAGPAAALFGGPCSEVSQLMGNVAGYSTKLKRMSDAMSSATAQAIVGLGALPSNLSLSSNSTINATLAQDLVGMAALEADGLGEAARYVVKMAGPVITDRLLCTFSGVGRKHSFGLAGAAACLVAVWATS